MKSFDTEEFIARAYSYAPRSTLHASRAFTLIEVLVAMAVLSILILLAANVFQGSSSAFNIGTQKADMNTAARAAMDFMARELESAVAGPIEAASLSTPRNLPFILSGGIDVQFVAISGDIANGRALRGSRFKYEERRLKHERFTTAFEPYTGPTWGAGSGLQTLITNVWSLTMMSYANESELTGGGTADTNATILPFCLDVAIEILSDDDIRRALALSGAAQTDFVARNAKVYTTRVYFPNRMGYGER